MVYLFLVLFQRSLKYLNDLIYNAKMYDISKFDPIGPFC